MSNREKNMTTDPIIAALLERRGTLTPAIEREIIAYLRARTKLVQLEDSRIAEEIRKTRAEANTIEKAARDEDNDRRARRQGYRDWEDYRKKTWRDDL